MKQKTLTLMLLAGLILPAGLAYGAQAHAASAHRLVTAKSIYVEPMPDHLDQWLIQDLRAWGKYQVSGTRQGVDLVIRSKNPDNKDLFAPHGVVPSIRRPQKTPPVLSVTIVNWVTGERLWQADILNTGPKKNQSPAPPGPRTEIDARHMKPDQIAERCTNLLRHYVEGLEQAPAAKP